MYPSIWVYTFAMHTHSWGDICSYINSLILYQILVNWLRFL